MEQERNSHLRARVWFAGGKCVCGAPRAKMELRESVFYSLSLRCLYNQHQSAHTARTLERDPTLIAVMKFKSHFVCVLIGSRALYICADTIYFSFFFLHYSLCWTMRCACSRTRLDHHNAKVLGESLFGHSLWHRRRRGLSISLCTMTFELLCWMTSFESIHSLELIKNQDMLPFSFKSCGAKINILSSDFSIHLPSKN